MHPLLLLLLARSVHLNQFYQNTTLKRPTCHQDNPTFACPQFNEYNCLNILVGKTCYHKKVKTQ